MKEMLNLIYYQVKSYDFKQNINSGLGYKNIYINIYKNLNPK